MIPSPPYKVSDRPPDLDIGVPRCPEQVGDPGPAHRGGHGLAGGLDAGEQLGQITWTEERK